MAAGSAYPVVKSALVTRLDARSGLAGVKVAYEAPEKGQDVRGDSGTWERIHFDIAEGTAEIVILTAGQLVFDEEYVQTCIIQVLNPDSLGTQQAADQRAGEILYEVLAELSDQANWDYAALGLGPDDFEYVTLVPTTHKTTTGFLTGTDGHGARIELGIRVRARKSFNT